MNPSLTEDSIIILLKMSSKRYVFLWTKVRWFYLTLEVAWVESFRILAEKSWWTTNFFNHQDKKIYLINMLREENQIFSELFEKGVEKYLRAGKKIWILINKKGHTWGTICHSCGHIPQCEKLFGCDQLLSSPKRAEDGDLSYL